METASTESTVRFGLKFTGPTQLYSEWNFEAITSIPPIQPLVSSERL